MPEPALAAPTVIAPPAGGCLVLQLVDGQLEVPSGAVGPVGTGLGRAAVACDRAERRAVLGGRPGGYVVCLVVPLPTVAQAQTWLEAHGWRPRRGPAANFWVAPSGAVVNVGGDPHAARLQDLTAAALAGIAAVEARPELHLGLEMVMEGPAGR